MSDLTEHIKAAQTADGPGVDPASDHPPVPGPSALAGALAAVQAELPTIAKGETAKVPTKSGGTYEYTYADLSDITDAVLPLLARNMLAWTCRPTLNAAGRFVLAYELMHVSGENRTGEFPLPDGSMQQLGGYITYARRYCLCAVTGVQPRDDDTDARATTVDQQLRSAELTDARDAVRGAWAHHFGKFVQREAEQHYTAWSEGGKLTTADPGQLRRYAAYLSALPPETAGSDPADTGQQERSTGAVEGEHRPRPASNQQRVGIIAALKAHDVSNRSDQMQWISDTVGEPIKSRSDLTFDQARTAIDRLISLGWWDGDPT